jgi:hypothetical protein
MHAAVQVIAWAVFGEMGGYGVEQWVWGRMKMSFLREIAAVWVRGSAGVWRRKLLIRSDQWCAVRVWNSAGAAGCMGAVQGVHAWVLLLGFVEKMVVDACGVRERYTSKMGRGGGGGCHVLTVREPGIGGVWVCLGV